MRPMLFLIFCTTVATLLVGCGGSPTKTSYYLLRSEVSGDVNREMSSSGINLMTVKVASYIDQDGLVLATGGGQIHVANHHQWAEPLRHSLTALLANQITKASGIDVYEGLNALSDTKVRLDVDIDQLHGGDQGRAVLVARWTVSRLEGAESGQKSYRFAKSQALDVDGYPALVASERQLLNALAEAIAASL